jgi:molecular chaperone DnaJ
MIKDYYQILQLPTHATIPEIKQAYRRLAMMYHPDKNANDLYAQAQFTEVKEAYEVLMNPRRKETYLQERWYNQSIGRKRTAVTVTPVSILKLALELEKYVSNLDVLRMNKEGLSNYIRELLATEVIEKLEQFNEPAIIRQIVTTLLMAMRPLPLAFIKPLSARLEVLAANDPETIERIKNFVEEYQRKVFWEKYKLLVILLFTLVICLLIYLTSK